MTPRSRPLIGLLAITLVSRGGAQVSRHEFTELHLGVATHIVLYADATSARDAARAAFTRIAALEDVMSDWRTDSEVRRLSASFAVWTPVSAGLFEVLARALQVAPASGGAFDPTVGPYVALWRETRRTGRMPEDSDLAAARRRVGWRLVALDTTARAVRLGAAGMSLDLGGIAKGYILDQALATLRAHGIGAALIEAGGDIVTGDPPPGRLGWMIAGVAGAHANVAVSTSGTGEQYVEIDGVRYAHVVDPRTGLGVTVPRTVTVIARDAATADALATALVVLGPDDAAGLVARFPDVSVSWRE